jgi:tetrapyrrole methylase family protein/MazG family protein
MTKSNRNPESLLRLIETVHRLRAPGGCAWDRAQTHQSLRQYLIEESHEVLDVLDQIDSSERLKTDDSVRAAFREELGDLLMQVLLHSEMASETGAFDIYDVAAGLDEKLIRRHPHVFGEVKAGDEETAFQTWEKQKAKEKASKPEASILDGLPKGLPLLQRVFRVLEKVTKVGFQWSDMKGPLEKVDEELAELKTEIAAVEAARARGASVSPEALRRMEGEFGDILFSLCNVAYLMKVNPEDAFRGMLARFEARFRHVERRLKESGKTFDQSTLAEMDVFWNEAKALGAGAGASGAGGAR